MIFRKYHLMVECGIDTTQDVVYVTTASDSMMIKQIENLISINYPFFEYTSKMDSYSIYVPQDCIDMVIAPYNILNENYNKQNDYDSFIDFVHNTYKTYNSELLELRLILDGII